jgi:hypothetical protein
MAAFMVTAWIAGLLVPVQLPEPVPVQPCQTYRSPLLVLGAVAEIVTVEPALSHPLEGLTVPKFVDIVSQYWV